MYRRDDGIVIVDPEKAAGRKDLVSSCPYRRIYWNEEQQVAQKCTMCAHLLDQGWKEPRCVGLSHRRPHLRRPGRSRECGL